MTLQYVGRAPDSDFVLVNKGYVDTRYGQVSADATYTNTAAAAVIAGTNAGNTAGPLTTQTHVDAVDSALAHKSYVTAADATFLALTDVGVASKAASLDSNLFVPSAQINLSTLLTDKVATVAANPTVNFTTHLVNTTTITEFAAATLAIPDPGYPYHLLPFATVQGAAAGVTDRLYRNGVGCYGRIAIMDENSRVWGGVACTGDPRPNYYHCVPHALTGATPTNTPPAIGAHTLTMYFSLLSGNVSGFQFTNTNFVFYALIFSAV
jgi:hypothetical protein